MKNVYIDAAESHWIAKRFKKDMVTFDEILSDYEDLIIENEELKEELEDLKEDLQENYRPISPEEQYE